MSGIFVISSQKVSLVIYDMLHYLSKLFVITYIYLFQDNDITQICDELLTVNIVLFILSRKLGNEFLKIAFNSND